jgi:S-DNA-T family DNA segregation ATPase FtsK/SpoIIIE
MSVGESELRPPPTLPARTGGGPGVVLMLLPALAGLGAMALIFAAGGTGLHVAAGLLFGVSMVAVAAGQLVRVGGDRSRRIANARRDYLRYLSRIRRDARNAASAQRQALTWVHPSPEALASLTRTSRLWERRPTDPDFATTRVGVGDQQLSLTLPVPEEPPDDVDPVAAMALDRLVQAHRTVPGLPVALSLRSFSTIRLEGDRQACRRLAAAVLLQAICWHAPSELRLGACLSGADPWRFWDWLKWTPHLTDPTRLPTQPPAFAVADNLRELELTLADDLAGRPWAEDGSGRLVDRSHVLVLVDGVHPSPTAAGQLDGPRGLLGVTVLHIGGPGDLPPTDRSLRLRVTDTDLLTVTVDRVGHELTSYVGTPDQVTPALAGATCRGICDLRVPGGPVTRPEIGTSAGLTELLGVANVRTLDPAVRWRPRPPRERLRVAIGVGGNGQPVELDLKEAAEGGMGPHGLIVGATGSGKSELLRTLVLGLAITHPPDVLNFVLVDFKGGATFARLDALPHTSALITNLTDQLELVDRMRDALAGELTRRMELLRAAGEYASLRDYDRARADGAVLAALPTLLVVVDEFSELLTAEPEFLDLFVTIGRVGRSLGVHLLLASQRLEEGRLRGLDTHLSYRIGLKTFSAAESRIVLGVDDAFHLPTAPGNGYLRFDTTELVRFKAAYVSGPVREQRPERVADGWVSPQVFRLAPAGPGAVGGPADWSAEGTPEEPGGRPSLLEIAVARLDGAGVPAHEVWLPPLGDPPALDLLLPASPQPTGVGFGRVPLGWVDRPLEQTRGILELDLSGAAGHVAVVGAPQSGKSTAVRTLVCALALTHGPDELSVYCLDLGGGSLSALADLPQVGVVAGRLQPDLVRRTVTTVERVLAEREAAFAATGLSSVTEWRRARAAATDPSEQGDVVLVVDGWGSLRESFEPLEPRLLSLAARGLNYGVHLVLTATRWPELRPALKDLIGSRIELRLGDPLDSVVNSRIAATVPMSRPGRGLTRDGLHLLTAVPRVDGRTSAQDLPAATATLVETVRDRWPRRATPGVRLLPALLRTADLPVTPTGSGVLIGLDEDLQPVHWDPATDRHLMLFGEDQSGKSTLLTRLVRELANRSGPPAARFVILDPDRRLTELAVRQLGTAVTGRDATPLIAALAEQLTAPPPGPSEPNITGRPRPDSPAEIYLIIDNYERLAGSAPLAPLVPLLAHATELGLHIIVARQARGAARAVYDTVYTTLKDMGTPALLLSGPDTEGPIIGRTGMSRQPPGRGVWIPRRGAEILMQAVLDADHRARPDVTGGDDE